jgi:hypothetical protein
VKQFTLFILLALLLVACGSSRSEQVPTSQLPDPALYAVQLADLPAVGVSWQQSYNQTTTEQGYKWSYQAFQAYQPGELENQLDSAFAINNDVILYEVDMSRADLPSPPTTLGSLSGVDWKSVSQPHQVGDRSSVWKTNIGELLTPVWWLEFYRGHAYVRISLFGFPDQIAEPFIFELADTVAARLPANVEELKQDASGMQVSPPAVSGTLPGVALPTASATP